MSRRIRFHLDTDIGGDIDDLCALAMVLNWPDVDLLAVTTVSDDQGKRAGYASYALTTAGRADVAVAAGADVSLGCYRSKLEFPDERVYWPAPIPPAPGPVDRALTLLQSSIEQDAIVAAIGPFTNLALLEKRHPGVLRSANLFLMGGYVYPPRRGFPAYDHRTDYNVQVDVQSAQDVFEHSSPTLVPISVTVETWLRTAYLDTLRQNGPLAKLIARQGEAFAASGHIKTTFGRSCEGLPEDTINFQHDPLTCAIGLGWNEEIEIREIRLKTEIQNGWLQQTADANGNPTRVVTGVDGERFSDFWLSTVAREKSSRQESRPT
jgi:purine nucleosidase